MANPQNQPKLTPEQEAQKSARLALAKLARNAWDDLDNISRTHGKKNAEVNAAATSASSLTLKWARALESNDLTNNLGLMERVDLLRKLAAFVKGQYYQIQRTSGLLGRSRSPYTHIKALYEALASDREVTQAESAGASIEAARMATEEARFGVKPRNQGRQ